MGSPLLDVSPLAALLLDLAARKASGRLSVGGRVIEIVRGAVTDVLPAAQDESLEQFLVKSGRVSEATLAQYEEAAKSEHVGLPQLLKQHGVLSEIELRQARRALLVDRLTRALRVSAERAGPLSPFEAEEPKQEHGAGIPLPALLLDALSRAAASADAGLVGANLNFRIDWLRCEHESAAREWADFGEAPQRPAVSTVLAKRPAAAPRIAALLRAGLLRLDPPGRTVPSQPPPPGSLPAPPPRISAIPSPLRSASPPASDPLARIGSVRPPRLRLDPGQAPASAEPLEPTALPQLPEPSFTIDDPLSSIEQRIAALEARGASGPERARAFCALADVWRDRFGSLERACRAFREAAAADPSDATLLQQAALHCHYLGEPELAVRYAGGAVLSASIPIERASAQRLRAMIERAAGHTEACIEALCEAAADDPGSPQPHEQVAALLLDKGNIDGANAHARLAATALQEEQPERALALLAWAWSLAPSDVPTAYEYASLLDATGRRMGAVAVLSEAASRSTDVDRQRKLRLAAAERAETAERLDVAAELLVDAFDAEPHFDLLYRPLDEDLAALGAVEYHAAVLEDIATVCADEHRAHWLSRAGCIMLQADDQHEAALWLFFEALLTDPRKPEPLQLLRGHARSERELTLLAHGLRAAINACANAHGEIASSLRYELAQLPELPEYSTSKIQLLGEAVATGTASPSARATLETLHGLSRDAIGLATFLEDQAELSRDRAERARLLSRLAAVHAVREDTLAVAAASENLLAIDPDNRIALARLERSARKLGDPRRLAHALLLRIGTANGGRRRARALCQMARAEELAGLYDEAAQHAADAVHEDPGAADAAFIVLRHAQRLEPRIALRGLRALYAVCGGSRALLATQAQVAKAGGDRTAWSEAIEAWVELMPSDAAAHRARLLLLTESSDAPRLLEAAEAALVMIPSAEVLEAAVHALDRLEALAAPDAACRLALRIAEEQGRADPALAQRAVTLARRSRAPSLMTIALELAIVVAEAKERSALLLELAAHHREQQAHAAEVRALLRALEGGARHTAALERLRELFARGGDGPRLLAVVELTLEGESDLQKRRALLLELAVIAHRRLDDPERAEHHLRALLAENFDEEAAVREALGAFLSLGELRWALTRCLAIADECPPELASRIHLWCAVTAEQRLDDRAWALEIARAASLRWPSYAEPLLVVERLTLATEDVATAMQTYDALIAAASGPHGRRALCYRAGRWLERAGLLEQALRRYEQAFELAPTTGAAFKALARVAEKTGRLERVVPCYEQLVDHLHENSTRFSLLSAAGELCLRELGDTNRGLQLLARANELSESSELDGRLLQVSRELLARDARAGKEALERFAVQLAERVAQLWNNDDKVRCLVRLAEVYSTDLGCHAQGLTQIDEALSIARREELSPELIASAEASRAAVLTRGGDALAAQMAKPTVPAPAPEAQADVAPSSARPKPAITPTIPVSPAVPGTASMPRVSRAELRSLCLAEPWRTDSLRELHALCSAGESSAQRYVLGQLISSFDPSIVPRVDIEFHSGLWRGTALHDAIAGAQPTEIDRLLATLWDCARVIPRFRSPLGAYGVSERDRISRITVGPVADAYAQAARALDRTDVPVYIMLENAAPARAVAAHPPAVLAGRGVALEHAALLYGMAHALWLAAPEHVIPGILPREDATELLEAAKLAFAAELGSASAGSKAKELAAGLWQSVPMREQRPMSEALRSCGGQISYEPLRARARATAARAALLCSGGLRAALRTLPSIETELGGLDLSREHDFARGCQLSAALAETVRCALSDSYLDMLERALERP